jgi:glycosyltransferase involved in cell wall biosynthesis
MVLAVSPLPAPELLIENLPPDRPSRRIAVVTESYPPEINGVALTIARLVQGLHGCGHEIQLVRPRPDPGPDPDRHPNSPATTSAPIRFDELLTLGLPIPMYPQLRFGAPSKRTLLRLWTLRRPDIVHIATEGPLGWSALKAARQLALPVTSDFRTNFHAYSRHYGVGWLARPILGYLRKFHNLCDRTMVPTAALRDELLGSGFARLAVVSRGVDGALFHPARRSPGLREHWGATADDPVLLSVGRLAAEKNLLAVLAAYEAARAVEPRTRLVMVGDGPQRQALQAACPTAHFAGARRGEDLATHYASADLFAFASHTETFGNVTTEALSSGLPVVAFDAGAAHIVVRDGHNGLLVPGTDATGFVSAVVRGVQDGALRHRLREHARVSVQHLDWASIVAAVLDVFEAAIAAPGAARGRQALSQPAQYAP